MHGTLVNTIRNHQLLRDVSAASHFGGIGICEGQMKVSHLSNSFS